MTALAVYLTVGVVLAAVGTFASGRRQPSLLREAVVWVWIAVAWPFEIWKALR